MLYKGSLHSGMCMGTVIGQKPARPVWSDISLLCRYNTPWTVIWAPSCQVSYCIVALRVDAVIREHGISLWRKRLIANILARLKWISYIRFSCDQIPQIEAIEKVAELLEQYGKKPYNLFVYLAWLIPFPYYALCIPPRFLSDNSAHTHTAVQTPFVCVGCRW